MINNVYITFHLTSFTRKSLKSFKKKIENVKYVSHFIFLLAIINNLNG